MSDSTTGGAAFLNGQEIVNDARTLAYLDAGYGPQEVRISGGCACPRIRQLIECDGDPYASPASDPAPWYDASVPESADFAGFLSTEFEGMGSTYVRAPVGKITGGSVLGRLRPGPRTLTWRGYLFGRSECAVRFGLSWLTANLKGPGCYCGGEDLDLMVCCPELTQTPPVSGCTSLPAIRRPDVCPPFTQPDAFRQLKNVGLVAGPTVLSQRRIGCTSSCGNGSCSGTDTLIMEVEFSLLAGNPYLHGCPVCLCAEQPFPVNDELWCPWVKVYSGGSTAGCGEEECAPAPDCTRGDAAFDLSCPAPKLPVLKKFADPCFCDPLDPVQFCCTVPADSFGQFFEAAPFIEIYSGDKSMKATTVRFFVNPLGLDCCTVAEDPCYNCDSIQIRYIPPNSTFTIDGTTRTVSVLCPGQTEAMVADHLTVTPFAWPTLQCTDYCICVETEGAQVASNASVTISVVPREM